VASDAGVFVSNDLGGSWAVMGSNLPLVPVNDLDLHNGTRKLIAATYGRSMYAYDLNQDTVTTQVPGANAPDRGIALSMTPNPAGPHAVITIKLDEASQCDLSVIDLHGRALFRKEGMLLPRGENVFTRTDLGMAPLPGGVYVLLLETGMQRSALRFIAGD
jgi:hypothetical protein